MAITLQFPLSATSVISVYNPFYYIISSNNTNKVDFKYIADLFVDNCDGSRSIGRFKIYPNPTDSKGYFDPHSIYQNYVDNRTFNPTTTSITPVCNWGYFTISWGEEYDNNPLSAATGTTIYPNLEVSGGYFINVIRQWNESLNISNYDAASYQDVSTLFTTSWNFNFYKKIYRNEWETTQVCDTNAPSGFFYYNIYTFNSTGGTIGHFRLTNSSTSVKSEVPTGTKNLYNLTLNNLLGGGSRRVIDTDVDNYYVQISSGTNDEGVLYGFQIIPDCNKYEKTRIAFLDTLGGYNYWTFDLKRRDSMKINTGDWGKKIGYNYQLGDRGRITNFINADKTFLVTSGWLEQHESNFFEQLFISPSIYQINSNGTKVPLLMKSRDFEIKKVANDDLINYTIEFELAHKIYGQNG